MNDQTTVKEPESPASGAGSGSISDFAAQWIAEGFAYGCLCIAVAWSGAYIMWGIVAIWSLFLGPSKKKSNASGDLPGR